MAIAAALTVLLGWGLSGSMPVCSAGADAAGHGGEVGLEQPAGELQQRERQHPDLPGVMTPTDSPSWSDDTNIFLLPGVMTTPDLPGVMTLHIFLLPGVMTTSRSTWSADINRFLLPGVMTTPDLSSLE